MCVCAPDWTATRPGGRQREAPGPYPGVLAFREFPERSAFVGVQELPALTAVVMGWW